MSTRHVWGQYTRQLQTGYRTRYREVVASNFEFHSFNANKTSFYIGSNYYFSTSSGSFSYSGGTSYDLSGMGSGGALGPGYVIASGSKTMWYSSNNWSYSGHNRHLVSSSGAYKHSSESYTDTYNYYAQGSFLAYISSPNSSAYPSNDYTGSYWYVKQGSDSIDAASVSLPQEINGGESTTITVTPGSGKQYGGTVTYIYQYKLDNGQWTNLTSTTMTITQLAIPRGIEKVQVRVQAKDDIGFTSSDYTTSEEYEVSNGSPPFIQWNYPSSSYDIGEVTEPFTFDYTIMDSDYGDIIDVAEGIVTKVENWVPQIYTNTYEDQSIGTKKTFDALTKGTFFRECPVDEVSTIRLVLMDNYELVSDVYEVSFTKINDIADITLREPMSVEGAITEGVVYVTGLIPEDATFWVKVTNNAKDDNPVWQDITSDVLASRRFTFENTVAQNGFSFNFQVYAKRGESKEAGFIDIVMGGFE